VIHYGDDGFVSAFSMKLCAGGQEKWTHRSSDQPKSGSGLRLELRLGLGLVLILLLLRLDDDHPGSRQGGSDSSRINTTESGESDPSRRL